MAVNFFQNACKTSSDKNIFGICDDSPNSPAYIDENTRSKWIAIVSNPQNKRADFYAIDNCVEILKPNGDLESRCDGLLKENQNLIFIELKERESKGWFGKGSKQLKTTIDVFLANYNASNFNSIEAYVCNSLKPRSNPARASSIQKFYDETGFILRDKQLIII